ncbi:MAG: hypothetical protein JSS98_10900 [Bacteroidetes bacterium]|nr:hypothetical protein [Bacteroidota bacterium]
MSKNKDLFKEAIADAKAVREAALQNAKIALEEALTPKLQSMISAKLQEIEEEGELEEVDSSELDNYDGADKIQQKAKHASQTEDMKENEEELEEDFDLSAILAELEKEEELEEAKKKSKNKDEEELEEAKKKEEKEEENGKEEVEEDDEKIVDLSIEELKDLIKDIIHSELESEDINTHPDENEKLPSDEPLGDEPDDNVDLGNEEGIQKGDEEEVDLEELLAELDALNGGDSEKELEEAISIKGGKNAKPGNANAINGKLGYKEVDKKKVHKDHEEELEEALSTIKTLRNELNETNLLNAKLLYVNKIFKAKNLSESQKLKVIASFDKATTPAQAKELFESIQSSSFGSKKSIVKESLGFASKAIGNAPKKQIIDSNDQFARWAKLANIK